MAVTTAGNLCGYTKPEGGKPCARRVKTGAFRCWEHEGKTSAGEASVGFTSVEDVERERRRIAAVADEQFADASSLPLGRPEGLRQSLLREFTPVASDALEAIDAAYREHGADLSVPAAAHEAAANGGAERFARDVAGRIGPERVSRMRVMGARRMTVGGKKQHFGEVLHEVVVIDQGTSSEVVVDPFMAMFAPVRDNAASVDEQLPNGLTPFGDLPWVGPVHAYVGGDYLSWDKFSMARLEAH